MTLAATGDDAVAMLVIPIAAEEFRHASIWLADVARQQGVCEETIEKLDLCLNEALANILSYGGTTAAPVTLSFHNESGNDLARLAVVCIKDPCRPFDPTAAIANPRSRSLATAELGGHGLVIIRAFADQMSYDYFDHQNVLRFAMSWQASK